MAAATPPINGLPSSLAAARKHYNAATRSFLVRDYPATASSLQDALSALPPVAPDAWFRALEQSGPRPAEIDLKRRCDILQITFLATVRSSASALSPAPHLSSLLQLPPAALIKALWSSALQSSASSSEPSASEPGEILPSPRAAFLHPSIAIALTLAALKVDEPRLARSVAEAWLGSAGAEVERVVWEASQAIDWATELPLDGVGASGGNLSSSSVLGGKDKDKPDSKKTLVGAWIKLLDLLVLHVLPKLGEWEAAGDFVRLQGVENGGWIPDERVEATLLRLTQLQQEEAATTAFRMQRHQELEAAKAAAKRESRSSAKDRDKGKGRVREGSPKSGGGSGGDSPASSPGKKSSRGQHSSGKSAVSPASSPPSRSPTVPPASGFAGLRSSLSSYLARPPPSSSSSLSATSTTATPPSSKNPFSAVASYFRYHYSTDPVRLLSLICFFLALTTWMRRRFSLRRGRAEGGGLRIGDGVRLVLGKVAETARMATKVTM
ncbi:SPOSA6832_03335 [Sporobolomyces salmonicolor]|uniref:SPOSA6832_03335-mRNA-1:cds n=1 Tax=Sporidiobolus salmonicolor TaxID=5005 RepID=A0A0D6EPP7_SPOSA|nr:SPOSA6832_03335 [Sporobolomyces salmonicolor]